LSRDLLRPPRRRDDALLRGRSTCPAADADNNFNSSACLAGYGSARCSTGPHQGTTCIEMATICSWQRQRRDRPSATRRRSATSPACAAYGLRRLSRRPWSRGPVALHPCATRGQPARAAALMPEVSTAERARSLAVFLPSPVEHVSRPVPACGLRWEGTVVPVPPLVAHRLVTRRRPQPRRPSIIQRSMADMQPCRPR
jgi:hypothetical protein